MDDDIDVGLAVVVLDLEADFVEFGNAIRTQPPGEQPGLWDRQAKKSWSKVFMMSTQFRQGSLPAPEGLGEALAVMQPREAALYLVAQAGTAVSGASVPEEVLRLEHNVARFLQTPEGRERKAVIDREPRT
jgi:hypothetical protein